MIADSSASPGRSTTLRYAGLAYGFVAYVLAIGFWPWFILFIGNLARIYEPLLPRTVSVAAVILPTWQALAIDVGLLAAFALHHSFLARDSIKKLWWPWIPAPFRRATFSHVANVFAFAIVIHWQPIPIVLWQLDYRSDLRYLVFIPFALGWIGLLIGARSFNLSALFGLRQIWFWFKDKPYEPIDISKGRIYRLARHPEFLGVFAGVWVTADMTVGHFLLASTFTAYSLIALRVKERELGRRLGAAYNDYCATVPMLGPHWLTAALIGIWLAIFGAATAMSWNKRLSDQQARGDIKRFHQALVDYKAMTGSYPPGHAIPDCEHPVHKPQYDELMTRLMSAGVLPEPLAHPARRSQGFGYCYGVLYKDDKPVPLVWTWLQSSPLNNAGEPGTCRPFEKAWACSSGVANHDYCLCLP